MTITKVHAKTNVIVVSLKIAYVGFLQVLSQLTTVGPMSELQFLDQFHFMANRKDSYFTLVIENASTGKVVAAGTILIEYKFVHMRGRVGHIEDIVVDSNQRGLNLGLHVIEALKGIGKRAGCYKVILDCSDKNVPFYEKCGFTKKEVEMAWYIPENDIPVTKL